MKNPQKCIIFLGLVSILLLACQAANIIPLTVNRNRLLNRIRQNEKLWLSSNVKTYQTDVSCISVWIIQTYQVTVDNGQIIDHSTACQPGLIPLAEACKPRPYNPQDFTVEGTFAGVMAIAQSSNPDYLGLEFDPTYGYVSKYSYNDPQVVDEEYTCKVSPINVNPTP